MPPRPRKSLLVLFVFVLLACAAVPSVAAAEVFNVNTLNDDETGACNYISCTLRDAIDASNEFMEGPDEIEFSALSAAGTIKLEFEGEGGNVEPLPAITGELTIDGRTAPGWTDNPVIEIDGSEAETDSGASGLAVYGAGDLRVRGLAINGFDRAGILVDSGGFADIRENFLGTNLAGTTAKPNLFGVFIGEDASPEEGIGGECNQGNLISGNAEYGILDSGSNTEIRGNRIGTDASGASPLPNGEAGVALAPASFKALIIRSGCEGPGVGNTIAFNGGPGVYVSSAESYPVIYGNSIFSNAGLGIDFNNGEPTPPPTLLTAKVSGGELTVTGAVPGFLGGSYDVDLYASEECDPSGSGEGQTYLGEVAVSPEVSESFEETFDYPDGMPVVTATSSSGGELGSTGEFSECLEADLPPGPPAPAAPPAGGAPPVVKRLAPVNRASVLLEPVSGTILVKVPGSKKFQNLTELTSIPIGSIVDATKGKVKLTSVNAQGVEQSADFFGGKFKIVSQDRSGLVTLRLAGGDFSSCNAGASSSSATASKKPSRHLWGSGSGRFKTQGNFGAASVRGTIWLTKDQCKGTFFKVQRGVVSVADFVLDKTLKLPAGKTYWAKRNP